MDIVDHDHDHDHPHQSDDKIRAYYQILGQALKELLIEKDIINPSEIQSAMEKREATTPANGAKVVARAWLDSEYRERLFMDANSAVAEFGIELPTTHLVALENTAKVHNVVVCTLCSCYPRDLLGLPPAWYKSKAYRSRVVHEPREVLKEFGTSLPDDVEVRVHDSTADLRYLVVPMQPDGTDDLGEDVLRSLITRDTMIGVALAGRAA